MELSCFLFPLMSFEGSFVAKLRAEFIISRYAGVGSFWFYRFNILSWVKTSHNFHRLPVKLNVFKHWKNIEKFPDVVHDYVSDILFKTFET